MAVAYDQRWRAVYPQAKICSRERTVLKNRVFFGIEQDTAGIYFTRKDYGLFFVSYGYKVPAPDEQDTLPLRGTGERSKTMSK